MNAILQFFHYEHLPVELQAISKPFCDLAKRLCDEGDLGTEQENPEQRKALDLLLAAKDAAVRAHLYKY